jgi:CheY-specific phosphatase CheX
MPQEAQLDVNAALEALSQSLEAMAFISVLPSEQPAERPTEAIYIAIHFTGDASGTLEVIASRELGRMILSNVSGEPDVQCFSDGQVEDSLRELVNMTCGKMLRSVGGTYEIELPMLMPQITDELWNSCIASDRTFFANGEGSPIYIHLAL